MFWKCNFMPSSANIDSLLSKENVTLQELLDEDDVLQECKGQNKKLVEFLVKPHVLEQLVTYVTTEPGENVEDNVKYKYPNLAAELLTCDVPDINKQLATDTELLSKFYDFLKTDATLNPLLASFVSKVLGILMTRQPEQNWYSYQFTCFQVLEFLKSCEDFINLLLKHLGTAAIMDMLYKLITSIETPETRQTVLTWLNDKQVIQRLVALIDPVVDIDRHRNASQLICDVIKYSREAQQLTQEKLEPSPLLNTIEMPETISMLLDHMFSGEKLESCLENGMAILLSLLDIRKPQSGSGACGANPTQTESEDEGIGSDTESLCPGITAAITAILPHLGNFHELLIHPPKKHSIKTTCCVLEPPLGTTRLHVAKLVSALIATDHQEINERLAELGTIDVLLDIFFKYSLNNFLHTQVEQCIIFALNSEPREDGDTHKPSLLLVHIFIQCQLIQRILSAFNDKEFDNNISSEYRPKRMKSNISYMGHLTKISNDIVESKTDRRNGEFIEKLIAGLPGDISNQWEQFVSTTLAEINKQNEPPPQPDNCARFVRGSDYREIPYNQQPVLQQVFSDYQMQSMTNNFPDQFGFNNQDFNDTDEALSTPLEQLSSVTFNLSADENREQEHLFEQACAERIQPFEDSIGLWTTARDPATISKSSLDTKSSVVPLSDANHWTDDEHEDVEDKIATHKQQQSSEIKMDVDNACPWTDFGSLAMDTSTNMWRSCESGPTPEDVGWAHFDKSDVTEISSGGSAADTTPAERICFGADFDGAFPSQAKLTTFTNRVTFHSSFSSHAAGGDVKESESGEELRSLNDGDRLRSSCETATSERHGQLSLENVASRSDSDDKNDPI